jgi:tripartite-type tricarboxylate transporter receptor subunit TctC
MAFAGSASTQRGTLGALGRLAVIAGSALFTQLTAAADGYPIKPIDLYIGSAPSGSTDSLGRVLARSLSDVLGQPVVVHNTPGAGGAVMATELKDSAPDGYSLGMTISHAYTGSPVVTPEATHYAVDDFTHLASVSKGQCALVTAASEPYRTLDDLIAAARHGDRIVFASQSPLTRIVADYIAGVAGVHFRVITVQGGGEIMQTILGRHADFGFSGGPHVDFVEAGQMRVLASVQDTRLITSPEVPTLKELGYDIASCAMFVVSAPPELPEDIKRTLSAALEQAIASPAMKSLIESLKYPEYYLGPDAVTRALDDEADTLAHAVARINGTASDARGGELSPTFMPDIAAILVMGAAASLLIARLRRHRGGAILGRESWLFIGTASGVLAVSFVLMDVFGYFAGAAVVVAGFMALGRAEVKIIIGTAIGLPIALWLLFSKLLGFPLP